MSPGNWADLIQRAQSGCRDSFDILSRNCWTYLHIAAREELARELHRKIAPSDLVQQTFLAAYAKFNQFKGQSDKELISWLKTILVRQAATAGRHFRQARQSDNEIPIDDHDVSDKNNKTPSKKMMTLENREQMMEAMQQLPEHYREVLQLHLFDGQTFEAIGQRIGKSADAVRKTWVSALRAFKKLIPNDE
ncbi:MAG: sigma-70 family RNA polymerase sigma factor [Planctomycetaceae bacterium]|nr:sigma-70 family RNA polymerase sigma factor [Planctomycetaceae bacterium]